MPPVVTYTTNGGDGPSNGIHGSVFEGKKFFLVQRIPTRSRYVKDVQANGGKVVSLEQQADYIIADHVRKDAPDGSLSYTFIDTAIKNGELPPEDDHRAGRAQGSVREVGSTAPTKTSRTAYTVDDDRQLWAWVKDAEAKGVAVKGNKLYQDLEAVNPRHTWQSWRDRYMKVLVSRPPLPPGKGQSVPGPSSAAATSAHPTVSAPPPAVTATSPANRQTSTPASHETTPASDVKGLNSSRGGHATARRTGVGSRPRDVKRDRPETPVSSRFIPSLSKRARSESEEPPQSVSKRSRIITRQDEIHEETLVIKTQETIITISSDYASEEIEDEDEADLTLIPAAIDDIDDTAVNTSDNDTLVQLQLQMEMQRGDTPKLTTENLRRAQAESNPRTDSRAKDIDVDDEDQDQGDYASYLSNLVEAAAAQGQLSKDDFEALKQKQQQLDAMAEEEDSDYEHEDEQMEAEDVHVNREQDDQRAGEHVIINGRRVSKNFMVDTQDLEPGLEDLDSDSDYSASLREYSPDRAAPLNPDTSPSRASRQSSQLAFVGIPHIDDDDDLASDIEDHSEGGDDDGDEIEEEDDDDDETRGAPLDEDLDESLEIAPPEGGWNDLSSPTTPRVSNAALQQEPSPTPPPRRKGKGRATDADLDLDAAGPSNGRPASQRPVQAAKPQAFEPADELEPPEDEDSSQILDGKKLDAIVEEYTQRRGLEMSQVVDTLNMTSLRLPLVYTVLDALVAGDPVPNLPGIWTDAEDKWLESGEIGLMRMRAKHGREECEARLMFLKELREEEE